MAWRPGPTVRFCAHAIFADRQVARLFSPSTVKLFEIFQCARRVLVFRIDIQYGLESLCRRLNKNKAHVDRLVDVEDLLMPHCLAVMDHKDSGGAAIKKMPMKGIEEFFACLVQL